MVPLESPLHARNSSRPRLSLFLLQPRRTRAAPHPRGAGGALRQILLEPIELVEARGFRGSELRELYSIIEEHRDKFIIAWDEHFGR
jgi:hypothetical protein